MNDWIKKPVLKEQVEEMERKYRLDALTSSILIRRGITDGKNLLYYLEDDLRYQHNPFLFSNMEFAVDRINDAKEENEKVLIFGDRDVDGVSATTLLYECLKSMGMDVSYRLPGGDDPYGLSLKAVDDFAKEMGTLIITVDCGISNNEEIAHAGELGIDVIVVDHHNPPEKLPEPAIIIDAKVSGTGYPFPDISGCAVTYKLVSALRFSRTSWYKEEFTLLNAIEEEDHIKIDCLKVRNLVPESRLEEKIIPQTSIMQTKLPQYLRGQVIAVWEKVKTEKLLKEAFGSGTEFNMMDIQEEAKKILPAIAQLPLEKIKNLSTLAKYGDHAPTEIGGFYNIFVTLFQQMEKKQFPSVASQEEKDLQLVALAALADIMPMKNENRIFVKKGIAAINAGRVRSGLSELMAALNKLGKRLTSTDMSWVLVSHLNAAGRLGHPELAAELFLSEDPRTREAMAKKIIELNQTRKQLSDDGMNFAIDGAQESIKEHGGKLCLVIDERINRGVSGILAGRLVALYDIPALVITYVDDKAIGSMRSCRGFDCSKFLNKMDDLFINHGGHTFAAGFSFLRERTEEFKERIKALCPEIELSESEKDLCKIDAEIPAAYLSPSLLDLTDRFEPFGEENPPLLFMAKNLPVLDALIMGKGEKQHLKIYVGNGKVKWPALFWGEGERLHRDFEIGDNVDILFRVERNTFNGVETPQLILTDLKKSYKSS